MEDFQRVRPNQLSGIGEGLDLGKLPLQLMNLRPRGGVRRQRDDSPQLCDVGALFDRRQRGGGGDRVQGGVDLAHTALTDQL
jgi:hypothetical protein